MSLAITYVTLIAWVSIVKYLFPAQVLRNWLRKGAFYYKKEGNCWNVSGKAYKGLGKGAVFCGSER